MLEAYTTSTRHAQNWLANFLPFSMSPLTTTFHFIVVIVLASAAYLRIIIVALYRIYESVYDWIVHRWRNTSAVPLLHVYIASMIDRVLVRFSLFACLPLHRCKVCGAYFIVLVSS